MCVVFRPFKLQILSKRVPSSIALNEVCSNYISLVGL